MREQAIESANEAIDEAKETLGTRRERRRGLPWGDAPAAPKVTLTEHMSPAVAGASARLASALARKVPAKTPEQKADTYLRGRGALTPRQARRVRKAENRRR